VPALLFLTSCATSDGTGEAATGQRELPPGATAPLFNDLGDHTRSVTTRSPLAQRYFDQGLVLTYGFNHAEAARSFREAQRLDPNCAMCFWGEAYVLGPNINKPMDPADAPRAREASEEALSPVERALASALSRRYAAEAPADRSGLDRAYADAMRSVARSYPDDADVQALFAEALMDTMPWDYYLPDNSPKPETVEAAAALERALEIEPNHPGAIHYYIHAMEAVTPERAEAGADRLRTLAPGAGHLVHMPSHIYLRVGRYNDASLANQKAAAADESYITQCRAQGFYPAAYYPHNIDFLAASAAFEGRSQIAIEAARKLVANIPPEQIEAIPPVEEFSPKYLYTLARFGRWETILAQPQPDPDLRYALGAWHYARGLAFAAHGQIPEARASLAEVRVARDWWEEQDMVFFSNSSPEQLLEIASLVLAARIDGAQGNWAKGVPSLEAAVTLQDALPYTEPPPWYFPTREALGDVLLRSGRPAEARPRSSSANSWRRRRETAGRSSGWPRACAPRARTRGRCSPSSTRPGPMRT
jgi:tetratricopeptide (TPR) repeat protein